MWAKGTQKRHCSALPSEPPVARKLVTANSLRRFQGHSPNGKGRSLATRSVRSPSLRRPPDERTLSSRRSTPPAGATFRLPASDVAPDFDLPEDKALGIILASPGHRTKGARSSVVAPDRSPPREPLALRGLFVPPGYRILKSKAREILFALGGLYVTTRRHNG